MTLWTYNMKDGYAEAILRGLRQGFLTVDDYKRLGMAESLEDMKAILDETDYGNFLQNEVPPLSVTIIGIKCREKMSAEFQHLRSIANEPLIHFLDFIATEKMIDNVVSLIRGALNKKNADELLQRIDPLGWFPEMKAVASLDLSSSYEDLYRMLLVDTPVGAYFESYFKNVEDKSKQGQVTELTTLMTEQDLELMRSSLKKDWLEDFYAFCINVGGDTAKIMGHMLRMEADFRVLTVTLNTMNTPLSTSTKLQDRNNLYPSFGYLYPDGINRIRKAWNDVTVRAALEPYPKYLNLYDQCKVYYVQDNIQQKPSTITKDKQSVSEKSITSMEDLLFAEYVQLCEETFEHQFHYGIFYAWVKLKEQEIRNILWIADMILLQRKDQMSKILPIFQPRY